MDQLLSLLLELLLPLRFIDRPEAIKGLLKNLGYALPEDVLPPDLPLDFNAAMSESLALVSQLKNADTLAEKLAAVAQAEDLVRTIWNGAGDLQTTLKNAFQAIPQFLTKTNFEGTFAKRLLDYLLIKYLQKIAPRTWSFLELTGITSAEAQEENLDLYQSECVLLVLHFDRIGALIQSPKDLANDLFAWESQFDSNFLLDKLSQVMNMFGGAGNLLPIDSPIYNVDPQAPDVETQLFLPLLSGGSWPDSYWQLGVHVQPLEADGALKKGLAIVPYADGEVDAIVTLNDWLKVIVTLSAGVENGLGIFLRPPADLEIQKDLFSNPSASTDVDLSLELVYSGAAEQVVLFGSADQSHLSAHDVSVKVGVSLDGGQSDAYVELSLPDWSLVIDAGEGDGFIQKILSALRIEIDGSLLMGFSLTNGFYIDAGAELCLTIPINKTIGPFVVDKIKLCLDLEGTAAQINTTLTGSVVLGPFVLVVDNLGLSSRLDWDAVDGLLGSLDAYFKFKPPDGIGLAVNAGAVTGGGYLYIDVDAGKYAGVLALDLLAVGISAIGLVDTGLPGGGWSFFLALYIDIPSIQLGFGFTLNGVGGVAGINRTLDVDGLQSVIRAGSLDSILFPDDPIANAPSIIAAMETVFPSAEGRYVFGPVIKIGWGTPPLIEAMLGIVISLPDPIVIAVLGSVTAVLPSDDTDLVALHLDVAGVIDMGAASLSIDASLNSSHIVGFPLSGDMALRSGFGDAPSFLMALGGSHPAFIKPDGFPSINRLSLAINAGELIDIRFDCYFAITSNTLQFGASFEMSAEVEGFGISGGTEFDALIIFSPFSLSTHLGYHISVTAVGVDLMAVWLDVDLSGPNRWHLVGTATFTILGIDNTIHLDQFIGSKQVEPPPEFEDVLGQFTAALALPEAWSAGSGGGSGVVFAAGDPLDSELVVTPDGTLGVSQRVVPLGINIDKSDPWQIVGGYDHFDLEALEPGLASTGSLSDWFVVSSYQDLSAKEKLSAPSFEKLKSGIEFGGGEATAGKSRLGTLDYEQIVRDPELTEVEVQTTYNLGADLRADSLGDVISGQSTNGYGIAAEDTPIVVEKAGYAVKDAYSGMVLRKTNHWSASRSSVAGRKPGTVVVPGWEVENE